MSEKTQTTPCTRCDGGKNQHDALNGIPTCCRCYGTNTEPWKSQTRPESRELHYLTLLRKQCFSGDTEFDHSNADEILCEFLNELGYRALTAEYEKVDKWFA